VALSGVKCTVDSCHFWVPPNSCDAPKIEVDINHTGIGREGAGAAGAGATGTAARRAGAGMEIGEVGVYRRGVVEPEGTAYEVGDLEAGARVGGQAPGGRAEARKSEHTCCRTFRRRS